MPYSAVRRGLTSVTRNPSTQNRKMPSSSKSVTVRPLIFEPLTCLLSSARQAGSLVFPTAMPSCWPSRIVEHDWAVAARLDADPVLGDHDRAGVSRLRGAWPAGLVVRPCLDLDLVARVRLIHGSLNRLSRPDMDGLGVGRNGGQHATGQGRDRQQLPSCVSSKTPCWLAPSPMPGAMGGSRAPLRRQAAALIRDRASTLKGMDWEIFEAINGLAARNDVFEDFLRFFSVYAELIFGVFLVAAFMARGRWRSMNARHGVVAAALASIVALEVAQVISGFWDRPRPYEGHLEAHLFVAASPGSVLPERPRDRGVCDRDLDPAQEQAARPDHPRDGDGRRPVTHRRGRALPE